MDADKASTVVDDYVDNDNDNDNNESANKASAHTLTYIS